MNRRLLTTALIALVAAFTFAACGDDSDSDTTSAGGDATTEETTTDAESGGGGSSAGDGGTLDIAADPSGALAYTTGSLSTDAGEVTVNFDNPASTPHDVRIEGPGGDAGGTDVISGDTATATVTLEPGTYTYYCSVSGHRDAGMEGELTVK